MMAKLSTGFAGATTRSRDVTKEVETRMAKRRLDTFTDDFNPPGPVESTPGEDRAKPGQAKGYGKPHDDSSAEAPAGFTLAASGNARDQGQLDYEDEIMQREQGGIKPAKDQFPGKPSVDELIEARMKRMAASDNAGYDVHQTDPARLDRR